MTTPLDRPPARQAPPELLVLARWEEHVGWLLEASAKWPKRARFTLTRRIEEHALDVLELLVAARYQPRQRHHDLQQVNRLLERMRFLLRTGQKAHIVPMRHLETGMRGIDEVGRMVGGWLGTLKAARGKQPRGRAPAAREEAADAC